MTEDQTTLAVLLFSLAIGLAVALVAWLVSKGISEIPPEDRQYKDPPPLGFRLAWWPIQWISYVIEPFMSRKRHAASLARLRKAGLDYSILPQQFSAARIVCGLLVAGLLYWLVDAYDSYRTEGPGLDWSVYLYAVLIGSLMGFLYPAIWLRDRLAARRSELLKTFPFYLDIITLCVEAGLNLQGAIRQAVLKGPKGVLRDEFQRVLRDIRAGKTRADSLRDMSDRLGEVGITNFCSAVIHAERMGMSLAPVLRSQADQRRSERFFRAEKLAMEAPVKMLFPLIAFIFPCTFVVLFFPIVMKFMQSGL